MSETKQAFSIDKPGAYKLRGGGIADIVEVNYKSAFGWLRTDTAPMSIRRWDRTGIADAGCWDIIEAIPFVVDGPGRYMMRNWRVAEVGMIAPSDKASQPVRGIDRSASRTWHLDGRWSSDHNQSSYDLVRKMHPLEQELGAKASEAPKAPETQAPLDKPVFKITEPGVYCTRNGRVVNIHEVTSTTAHGHWKVSGNKREWPLNGRTHASIDLGSDIVMKAPPADGVFKITDVLTRLRTDWDRLLAEREEQARKNSRGPKTPKTPTTLHDVMQGIEGKPTQQPSEEQLKLAYTEPPKPVTAKKPTVAITQAGKYRARNGGIVTITSVYSNGAMGFTEYDGDISGWGLDGQYNEHCEDGNDIVEKIEQHEETKTLDPIAKWSEEAMQHIEEYVGLMKKEGKPMDPLIEEALRVFRPDLCPPKAGQEKTGAEVLSALGKAATKVADEPKKPSAGFDLVIIRLNEQKCMLVVGDYENDDGDVKVRPIDDLDPVYVQRKCPDAIILQGHSYMVCPDTNVTCVIHYGGEE